MRKRKLFCKISPLSYKISVYKNIILRKLKNLNYRKQLASQKSSETLKFNIYSHNSLIRRKLGNVDPILQNNKAKNLSIAAPKVNSILIKPGEIFSFWHLVGKCSAKKGYTDGLIIKNGATSQDIGGGMCQFTNLIHWMVLHSPLEIIEHHHHDMYDLFPDYGRTIPFGTGTSIMYNYLDYRFKNNTDTTYQLITYTTDTHLCGELRANKDSNIKYHVKCINEFFSMENNIVYRNNKIIRYCIDKATGKVIRCELIKTNHAKVMYDTSNLNIKNVDTY